MIVAAVFIVAATAAATALTAGVAGALIAGAAGFSSLASVGVGITVGTAALAGGLISGVGETINQAVEKGSENINLGSIAITTAKDSLDSALAAGSLFTGPVGTAAIWGGRVAVAAICSIGYGLNEGYSASELATSVSIAVGISATMGQFMFFSQPTLSLIRATPFIKIVEGALKLTAKSIWRYLLAPWLLD